MKICLKTQALSRETVNVTADIMERMPVHVCAPCRLSCSFEVHKQDSYYLLFMDTKGTLSITCQRCAHPFEYEYHHKTELAVCDSDSTAERLMEQFDCMVIESMQINLLDILTDDLHLFLPEKHEDIQHCHTEIREYLKA